MGCHYCKKRFWFCGVEKSSFKYEDFLGNKLKVCRTCESDHFTNVQCFWCKKTIVLPFNNQTNRNVINVKFDKITGNYRLTGACNCIY